MQLQVSSPQYGPCIHYICTVQVLDSLCSIGIYRLDQEPCQPFFFDFNMCMITTTQEKKKKKKKKEQKTNTLQQLQNDREREKNAKELKQWMWSNANAYLFQSQVTIAIFFSFIEAEQRCDYIFASMSVSMQFNIIHTHKHTAHTINKSCFKIDLCTWHVFDVLRALAFAQDRNGWDWGRGRGRKKQVDLFNQPVLSLSRSNSFFVSLPIDIEERRQIHLFRSLFSTGSGWLAINSTKQHIKLTVSREKNSAIFFLLSA